MLIASHCCQNHKRTFRILYEGTLVRTNTHSALLCFQVDAVKRAHVRGLLHAFKVPTQSILRTQKQANEQAREFQFFFFFFFFLIPCPSRYALHLFLTTSLPYRGCQPNPRTDWGPLRSTGWGLGATGQCPWDGGRHTKILSCGVGEVMGREASIGI